MTISTTIRQVATNNATAGVTSAGGTTIGVVAWLTDNVTVLSLTITFGMFCIAGASAYITWRFKTREDARKQEMHDVELQIKWAELRPSNEGTDYVRQGKSVGSGQ